MSESFRVSEQSLKLRYESSDASARGVFLTGLFGLFLGICIFLGLWWLFNTYKQDIQQSWHPRSAVSGEEVVPPEPRLQLNPREDLRIFRAKKLAILNSAGWVDPKGGWVHIPIEDAMKLLAEESQRGGKRK